MLVFGSVLRTTQPLLQSSSRHKIVIPPLSSFAERSTSNSPNSSSSAARAGGLSTASSSEYAANRRLSPDVAQFIPPESAAEVARAHQIESFNRTNDAVTQQIWRDSKSHLRRQQKLVEEFGVEGAVRETLQPTHTSFREQLRQRPLDRAILQEIYLGLHGRRIERKLKRGVSWEHWITKGDGTAPVFNTSDKAQQTFAFGGDIAQVRCATHPQQFPVLLAHPSRSTASTTSAQGTSRAVPGGNRQQRQKKQDLQTHAKRKNQVFAPREDLLPEVAVIGRTSSGKSSLINAVVNATITPYGHLRGTTDAVRFYNVANRLVLVDCPGYGHYDPLSTPPIDAANAVKAMRAYLACGAASGALQRRRAKQEASAEKKKKTGSGEQTEGEGESDSGFLRGRSGGGLDAGDEDFDEDADLHAAEKGGQRGALLYQPRNLRRVLVCVSAHGMQHLDYAYCDLLESYQIPFSVVLTKTDAAPIRFLARLTDYTRSQLVRYSQCKEILLTSSLRIAGIDKVQELLGSFAAADDPLHGATPDFSSIV